MPRRKQNKNYLTKYWKIIRNAEPGIILGVATILITILYGAWGVSLTKKSNSLNQQMLALSKKQVDLSNVQIDLSNSQILLSKTQNQTSLDLKHFAQLLNKTDTIIGLSDRQLILNQHEQKIANKNAEFINISNESKFYLATQNFRLLLFQPNFYSKPLSQWDSTQKVTFLNNADLILRSQLDNPYLLRNRYMFQEWLGVRDSINNFMFDLNFNPTKKTDKFNYGGGNFEESQKHLLKKWHNCFIAIADLEENTDQYMTYYRFYRFDSTKKRKQPSMETYKSLMEIRNKESHIN